LILIRDECIRQPCLFGSDADSNCSSSSVGKWEEGRRCGACGFGKGSKR
jgi:hypothetical protein